MKAFNKMEKKQVVEWKKEEKRKKIKQKWRKRRKEMNKPCKIEQWTRYCNKGFNINRKG